LESTRQKILEIKFNWETKGWIEIKVCKGWIKTDTNKRPRRIKESFREALKVLRSNLVEHLDFV
jgi:hypothetical protein